MTKRWEQMAIIEHTFVSRIQYKASDLNELLEYYEPPEVKEAHRLQLERDALVENLERHGYAPKILSKMSLTDLNSANYAFEQSTIFNFKDKEEVNENDNELEPLYVSATESKKAKSQSKEKSKEKSTDKNQ